MRESQATPLLNPTRTRLCDRIGLLSVAISIGRRDMDAFLLAKASWSLQLIGQVFMSP